MSEPISAEMAEIEIDRIIEAYRLIVDPDDRKDLPHLTRAVREGLAYLNDDNKLELIVSNRDKPVEFSGVGSLAMKAGDKAGDNLASRAQLVASCITKIPTPVFGKMEPWEFKIINEVTLLFLP